LGQVILEFGLCDSCEGGQCIREFLSLCLLEQPGLALKPTTVTFFLILSRGQSPD
ncbi:MAG: hypothetical protein GX630_10760, partial [Actinobacteria bacterium]|nr:hypothetical protein [Actinomycetota bacterium]